MNTYILEALDQVSLLEDIIDEDLQADYDKYYSDIPVDTFLKLIAFDPTYKGSGKMTDSKGKYGKWILDRYKKGTVTEDDFGHLQDCLRRFNEESKYLEKKDINQYKTLADIDNALNNADHTLTARQEKRKNAKEKKHADPSDDKIYSDGKWDIYVPSSYANSCKLGDGSSWCTANTNSDYYYNYYKENYGGDYYIIINRDNPKEKYQFHFESGQFMDARDRSIGLDDFFRKEPNLKNYFMPKILEILKIDEKDLDKEKEIKLDHEDIEIMVADSPCCSSYRGSMHKSTVADLILNPWDVLDFDSSYAPSIREMYSMKLSDYVCDELVRLRIIPEGTSGEKAFNLVQEYYNNSDNDYMVESLDDAFRFAYSTGERYGAIDQASEDVREAVNECIGDDWYTYDDAYMVVKFSYKDNLDGMLKEVSDPSNYFWENEKNILAQEFKNFNLVEPHYGWDGFDNEAFNEDLSYQLSEITEPDEEWLSEEDLDDTEED